MSNNQSGKIFRIQIILKYLFPVTIRVKIGNNLVKFMASIDLGRIHLYKVSLMYKMNTINLASLIRYILIKMLSLVIKIVHSAL